MRVALPDIVPLVLLLCGACPTSGWGQATNNAGASPIRFEEIAQKAGVHFVTHNFPTPNKNQIETMVAGVALFDYDGDGYLDIYLVNGLSLIHI